MTWLENLSPSYFALVMATGIISVGCQLMGPRALAVAFFALNCVAYVVIWALTLLRVRRYPRRVVADLTSHQLGFAFLTVVAGTGVLGTEVVLIAEAPTLATVLLGVTVALWLGLSYAIFATLTVKREKPPLEPSVLWSPNDPASRMAAVTTIGEPSKYAFWSWPEPWRVPAARCTLTNAASRDALA